MSQLSVKMRKFPSPSARDRASAMLAKEVDRRRAGAPSRAGGAGPSALGCAAAGKDAAAGSAGRPGDPRALRALGGLSGPSGPSFVSGRAAGPRPDAASRPAPAGGAASSSHSRVKEAGAEEPRSARCSPKLSKQPTVLSFCAGASSSKKSSDAGAASLYTSSSEAPPVSSKSEPGAADRSRGENLCISLEPQLDGLMLRIARMSRLPRRRGVRGLGEASGTSVECAFLKARGTRIRSLDIFACALSRLQRARRGSSAMAARDLALQRRFGQVRGLPGRSSGSGIPRAARLACRGRHA